MKLRFMKQPLLEALQRIQGVVEKKGTQANSGTILLSGKPQQTFIAGTDLEIGQKLHLEMEVIEPGSVVVSAKHLLEIVRELPNQPIEIYRKENHWIEISSNKYRSTLVGAPAESFPPLHPYEEKNYQAASVEKLLDLIRKTEFAVSTDPTRYNLIGVYFEVLDGTLVRMTATDGHRLSFTEGNLFEQPIEMKRGVIIPKKGINELKKNLTLEMKTVGLAFDRGHLFVKLPDGYLFVKLIDAEYANYKQVVPQSQTKTVVLSRDEFYSALRRVSLLASDKTKAVKLSINGTQLVLSSSNPDMGEATEEMSVEYEGESIEIGFNYRYLLDYLPIVQGDKIELRMTDRTKPGVFVEKDTQVPYTYLIMPMRI